MTGGSKGAICEHGKRKQRCKECGGGQICSHGIRRERCRECGGTAICHHEQRKDKCKICSGCIHGKRKGKCKQCIPCEHGVLVHKCKLCSPCQHGLVADDCIQCGGCEHGSIMSNCAICKKEQVAREAAMKKRAEKQANETPVVAEETPSVAQPAPVPTSILDAVFSSTAHLMSEDLIGFRKIEYVRDEDPSLSVDLDDLDFALDDPSQSTSVGEIEHTTQDSGPSPSEIDSVAQDCGLSGEEIEYVTDDPLFAIDVCQFSPAQSPSIVALSSPVAVPSSPLVVEECPGDILLATQDCRPPLAKRLRRKTNTMEQLHMDKIKTPIQKTSRTEDVTVPVALKMEQWKQWLSGSSNRTPELMS